MYLIERPGSSPVTSKCFYPFGYKVELVVLKLNDVTLNTMYLIIVGRIPDLQD